MDPNPKYKDLNPSFRKVKDLNPKTKVELEKKEMRETRHKRERVT